jgi:hypothetical protein
MNLFVRPIWMLVSYPCGREHPSSPVCGVNHRDLLDGRLATQYCRKVLVDNLDSSWINFTAHSMTHRQTVFDYMMVTDRTPLKIVRTAAS